MPRFTAARMQQLQQIDARQHQHTERGRGAHYFIAVDTIFVRSRWLFVRARAAQCFARISCKLAIFEVCAFSRQEPITIERTI